MISFSRLDIRAYVFIPPLRECIQIVISNCSNFKVLRVDTTGIVAAMQYHFVGSNIAMIQHITKAMSGDFLPVELYASIALLTP